MGYTVKEWMGEWLEVCVRNRVKARTYRTYMETVRLHILPAFGAENLSGMSALPLRRFISDKMENGNLVTGGALSAASVELMRAVLGLAFASALEYGHIADNPMLKVGRLKKDGRKAEAFTGNEQRKIETYIAECGKPEHVGILLSLYTGLRIGELLALEWSDIDFKRGVLSVTKTAHYCKLPAAFIGSTPFPGRKTIGNPIKAADNYGFVNGAPESGISRRVIPLPKTMAGTYGFVNGSPKSGTSRRVIPLSKNILELLKQAKRNAKSKYIIARANGGRIPTHSYQYAFRALLKKCKIRSRPFHTLRHTFATRALEIGADAKTVSELLGHSSAAFTLNRYAHSLTEYKIKVMNRLGGLLAGQTKNPVNAMRVRGSPTEKPLRLITD